MDADGVHIGEEYDGELPDVPMRLVLVSPRGRSRLAARKGIEAVVGDLADDPDAEARPGKG